MDPRNDWSRVPQGGCCVFLIFVFLSLALVFWGPELAPGLSDSMIDYVRTAHVERVEENVAEPAIILLGSGAMPVCIFRSLEETSGRRLS